MADVVPGPVCAAVTPTWSQTCLQALAAGEVGLLELCERCTETVILALRLRQPQRASSPAVRQSLAPATGEGRQQLAAGVDTPAGGRQVSPAGGGLVTSTDMVRQPDNLAGTPAAGGRLTLLRQTPTPATGARRTPARQRQSPAGDRLDAELLARAHQLIAASEATPGRRIGRGALARRLAISTHQARQLLAHYDTHASSRASQPDAGDTSTEVTSA